jgi:hypothetical protein
MPDLQAAVEDWISRLPDNEARALWMHTRSPTESLPERPLKMEMT